MGLHDVWQLAAITTLDELGRPYIADVKGGDLWYYPRRPAAFAAGALVPGRLRVRHTASMKGRPPSSPPSMVSEWFTHTPPEVVLTASANFEASAAETFKDIPLRDLYIFQGDCPATWPRTALAVSGRGAPPHPFTFSLGSGAPARETKGGTVHDCRQPQLHCFDHGRRRASDSAPRRLAGDALAPQRRRMAVLGSRARDR